MLATLKDTANTKNKVSNAFTTRSKSYHRYQYRMSITDNKAHLKVSFVYNRKRSLSGLQSRVTELKGQYGEEFSEVLIVIHCQKKTTINSLMRQ